MKQRSDFSSAAKPTPNNYDGIHQLPLNRRTIVDALHDATEGSKPRNPHSDPDKLKAEALIANAVFDEYIRPALRTAIGAPHYIEGPEKDVLRAKTKKGDLARNCDWARHANLLNNMSMAKTATDMLSRRGVLRLNSPSTGHPIDLVIVDADNTFINDDPNKPGLRMIDTKILVPIDLASGEQTYHILELRTYLAASVPQYEKSEIAYKQYREKSCLVQAFERAITETTDAALQTSLSKAESRAANKASAAKDLRDRINIEDSNRNDANTLIGYYPLMTEGKGWKLMSFNQWLTSDPMESYENQYRHSRFG